MIFIHFENDLPDAEQLQAHFKIDLRDPTEYHALITKRIYKSISTKNSKCGNLTQYSCQSNIILNDIGDIFNCDFTISLNDTMVDQNRLMNKALCSRNQILNLTKMMTFNESYIQG